MSRILLRRGSLQRFRKPRETLTQLISYRLKHSSDLYKPLIREVANKIDDSLDYDKIRYPRDTNVSQSVYGSNKYERT